MDDVIRRLVQGDQRTLSRLISLIEREDSQGAEVMARVYPHSGSAYCIGVTGPPGAGKSTLVDSLAQTIRSRSLTVGIVAVDPTSPFSGGAFLGDRIRMQRHYMDSGVYIRSMATRNNSGGLSKVIHGVVRLLDAAGKDVVLVETVGVGQTELGIMGVADSVIVVVMPESGDIIQTLKAGLMEAADIYVVNKADREGSNQMVTAINSMLHMSGAASDWAPPVLATQAHRDEGISELYSSIQRHWDHLGRDGLLEKRRQERRTREFTAAMQAGIIRRLSIGLSENPMLKNVLNRVESGELEPYSSAQELLKMDIPELLNLPPGTNTAS